MYIHSSFKFINSNEPALYYKKLVKQISSINLRRSSKFDVLGVYGACNCIDNIKYNKDLNIYLGSEYGVVSGITKVLPTLNNSDSIVMPFDFLNTNGNNAGFSISSALNTIGESMLINSNAFSFEHTLKFAYTKSLENHNFEALIGAIDESLDDIDDFNSITNINSKNTNDSSCFIYCNNIKQNAIAKIQEIEEFSSKLQLDEYLNKNNDYKIINHIQNDLSFASQTAVDLINSLKKEIKFILVKQTNISIFIIKIDTCFNIL